MRNKLKSTYSVSKIDLTDLKTFAHSLPLISNFKCFSRTIFLTVGQNNYGNKIPMYNNETRNQITFREEWI